MPTSGFISADHTLPPGRFIRAIHAAYLIRWGRHPGSISAEHGIGALKAPWLPLARTDAERALFARIRSALDPAGTLNPNVLPR